MNIQLCFFLCLGMAILGFIIAAINVVTIPRRLFNSGEMTSMIAIHFIAGLFYILGGVGVIGFGIAWIVTYLKG